MKVLLQIAAGLALLSSITTVMARSRPSAIGLEYPGGASLSPRDDGEADHKPPNIPEIPGPIPVELIVCSGTKLDRGDLNVAVSRANAFYNVSDMSSGSVRLFQFQTATWAFCNCKVDISVRVPEAEIRHADALLDAQCGVDWSGRVVSLLLISGVPPLP
ncbi:hypothetical protein F4803DRAFT_471944 [Xylaria telfairii]|nr:hypothetical protein F4803DRAFT_471944 [Xylaria telfairii]